MVCPLYHEKECVYVSGSAFIHMCIGLARMQGVWWGLCRWLGGSTKSFGCKPTCTKTNKSHLNFIRNHIP